MSKSRTFVVLVAVLTAVFLFFLYGFSTNSYRAGSGLSYIAELEHAGLADGARDTSDAHERIAQESEKAGVQFATGMTLSVVGYFVALLLVVGYVFGLPQLGTRRTFVAGAVITGIAALSSSGVQPVIGKPITVAIKAGLGLWLIGFVLFVVLVSIVWGIRKVRKNVGGVDQSELSIELTTSPESEDAVIERDTDEKLENQSVLKSDGEMAEDEKECPRCIEIIKLRAKYCRHCGYEYSEEEFTTEQNLHAEEERKRIEAKKERRETDIGINYQGYQIIKISGSSYEILELGIKLKGSEAHESIRSAKNYIDSISD